VHKRARELANYNVRCRLHSIKEKKSALTIGNREHTFEPTPVNMQLSHELEKIILIGISATLMLS
jgi:hypothetical protein